MDKKYKAYEYILSVIFIVWFIASIGLMIYFSAVEKQILVVALFGQFFFLMSLFILREKDKQVLIALAHLTVGLICIVGTLIYIAYPRFVDLGTKDLSLLSVSALAIVFGYILMVVHKFTKNKIIANKIYTISVVLFISAVAILIYFDRNYIFGIN